MYTRNDKELDITNRYPECNKDVIKFILDFAYHNEKNEEEYEVLRKQFMAGYCYYFALMLKAAFNRGEICWCAPYGHICWVDIDGIPYDIEGVCESEYVHLIPISYIKAGLIDFMHVPGKEFNATEEYINSAIRRYEIDNNLYESKEKITWEEINLKYPESFDFMTKDKKLQFITDCFNCYEKEGFSKKFWSPYEDKKSYIGKSFTVVKRCDVTDCDLECLPMWSIKFSDGMVFEAYPEEIIPSEMKENGCPFSQYYK